MRRSRSIHTCQHKMSLIVWGSLRFAQKGKAMYEGAGKEEDEEKKRGREERGKAVQRGVGEGWERKRERKGEEERKENS